MYLKQLKLQNWRNFEELETGFSPNVNIFIGQNAQGKTNLLEAVYFLALTRSHRINSFWSKSCDFIWTCSKKPGRN